MGTDVNHSHAAPMLGRIVVCGSALAVPVLAHCEYMYLLRVLALDDQHLHYLIVLSKRDALYAGRYPPHGPNLCFGKTHGFPSAGE